MPAAVLSRRPVPRRSPFLWLCLAGLVAASLAHARPRQPSDVLHSVRGATVADRFGTVVAALGDLDADGFGDWGVGAPRAEATGVMAGQVRVFSGHSGVELFRLDGDSPSDALGSSLASAGDIDADGHDDWIVGAPRGTPPAGSAQVRSGLDGSLLLEFVGRSSGDQFGAAVAGVGDVDGDGIPDLAVGAPHADSGGTNSGEVRVFSGAGGAELLLLSGQAWDQLGRAVCAVGDLNSDGHADVAVGAPFSDVGAFNGGSAYVVSGLDGSRLLAVHGAGIGDQLGFALAGAVDVDLDGRPDLLCAAPGADTDAHIDAGAAVLHSGADGSVLQRIDGLANGEYLAAVGFAGDLDGDGRSELLVGAASAQFGASESGRARVVSSGSGLTLATYGGVHPRDWFGASIAGVGDSNGDGRPDFVVGAPGHDDELAKWGYARVISIPPPGSSADGE